MTSDPLSDVLELVQARCKLSGRLVAGGDWGRRFANQYTIKFCAAVKGACWCFMDGMAAPARFEAGDVLVTNGRHPLVLASKPALVANAADTPIDQDADGTYRLEAGDDFVMLGGMVRVDDGRQSLLLDGLPSMLHVRRAAPEAAAIGWLLEQIVHEMEFAERPGRTVIMAELAQLLFVNTLRAHLAHAAEDDAGWLKGLGDRRLASALSRMHADPRRNWSLEGLAQLAGMSRTSFVARFREVMGVPPLTYLTNWRMRIAGRRLLAGATVAEAADAVGYISESAFSHAFKRTIGIAPGSYRKVARDAEAPRDRVHAPGLPASAF